MLTRIPSKVAPASPTQSFSKAWFLSLGALMAAHAAQLQAQEWTGATNGSWNVGTNWSTGTVPNANQVATFSQSNPANGVTTLGANQTIDGLKFGATATSNLSIGSFNDFILTLDGGATADLLVEAGSGAHTLWSALALTGSTQDWLNHSDNVFTVAGNLTLTQSINFGGTGSGGWVIGSANSTTLVSGADRNFVVANTGAAVDLTLEGLFKLTETTSQRVFRIAPAAGAVVDINAELANGDNGNGAVTIGYTAGNTGTVNLNVTKSYTGTTTINHGATLNVNAAINNAGVWDVDGGILNWNVTNSDMGALYLGGGLVNSESHVNIAQGVTMNLGNSVITENSSSQSGNAFIRGGVLALNATRTIEVRPSNNTDAELTIESIITDGSASSGITKTRNGTLILTADNTFTGNTTVNEGELILDHRNNNGDKLSATGTLTMGGGSLILWGNATQTSQQVVTSTTISAVGANTVWVVAGSGQKAEISLGNITRGNSTGGTLHVKLDGAQASVLSTSANLNGILGGYAVLTDASGQYFATVRDQKIVALNAGHFTETQSQFQNDVGTWQMGANAAVANEAIGSSNQLDLNSLRMSGSNDLQVVDQLNLRSGGLLIAEGTTASGIYGGTLTVPAAAFNGELIIHQGSDSEFTISSSIVREHNSAMTYADVTKSGSGTLILSGNNVTGARSSSTAGSGTIRIAEGVLALSGGKAVSDVSTISLDARTGVTLRLLSDEAVGNLSGGGSDGGNIELNSYALTINTSSNQTFNGAWSGSGTIVKQNMGAGGVSTNFVTNTTSSTGFTGNVAVHGGAFLLSGNNINTLVNAAAFTVNRNGALYIDGNGSSSGAGNKIGNSATIVLNGASGTFQGQTAFRGFGMRSDQNATREETFGVLSVNRGANYVTSEASSTGTSAFTNLIATQLTRSQNSTLAIRGTNLGASSGRRGNLRILAANEAAFRTANLTGGSGAAGSSTMSIVAWAIGQDLGANALSTTDNLQLGNSLVTYINTQGFRALDFGSEYTTYANASGVGTNNVRDTVNAADLTGLSTKNINAWVINNLSTSEARRVTGQAGSSLNLRSGTLLFTALDGSNNALSSSSAKGVTLGGFDSGITTGTGEYIVFQNNLATAGVTIESDLTSAAKLTKSGIGTLVLKGNNSALTDVTLNEGTVQISSNQNLGGNDGKLIFSGGTLKLSSGFTDDLSSKQIVVLGESHLQGNNGGRMGVLDTNGINTTFHNPISGDGEFVKTGSGTLTLGGSTATTHTGTFVLEQTMSGALNSALVQLILDNAGGNAIGGNLQMGAYALPSANGGAVARLARSEQIADHGVISYMGTSEKYAYFNLMGFQETVAGLRDVSAGGIMQVDQSGATVNASTLTLAGSDDYYFNGFLRNSASGSGGKLNLVHTGTGRQTLVGGNIIYTGQTTNSAGTLQYRDATSFDGSIANESVVEFEHTNTSAWNYSGVLSGSGTFVKTGTGTGATTLDSVNTMTGAVIVKAGELGLGNSGSIKDAQLVEVYANATFASAASVASTHHGTVSGNGTLKGNFILTKGLTSVGHLRPGASTHYASPAQAGNQLGQLSILGDLTLTGGAAVGDGTGAKATLQIGRATFNDASGIALAFGADQLSAYLSAQANSSWNALSMIDGVTGITAHDSISLTGGLTWEKGSTLTLEAVNGYNASFGDVIDLFDWTKTLAGSAVFADGLNRHYGGTLGDLWLPTLSGDLFYDLSAFRNHGLIAVVPEPSRALTLSLAMLALGLRRKRRS